MKKKYADDPWKYFEDRIDFNGPNILDSKCWIWSMKLNNEGYGSAFLYGQSYSAHRATYLLFNGAIADGMYICHKCDNPSCVNPDHLWSGTPQENTDDMIKKGRDKKAIGLNQPNALNLGREIIDSIFDDFLNKNMSRNQISRKYKISSNVITKILTGAHHSVDNLIFTREIELSINKRKTNYHKMIRVSGENHHNAKLTRDDVKQIRSMWENGLNQVKLSQIYGVRQGYISKIVNGKMRKKEELVKEYQRIAVEA